MPRLDRDGEVCLLSLGDDENRFSPDWLSSVRALIDEVAAMPAPVALVTVASGKFWSNGLDLDWLGSHLDQAPSYVLDVQGLFGRILTLPVPTVAAIQGHCFAAGAILALAHDWRVMRADRGFFCLPEVDIGLAFPVGMDALIRVKLPVATALEAMTTGRRYGGTDAAAAGIVTTVAGEEDLVERAIDRARPLAVKAGPTLATIKERMFAGVTALLADTGDLGVGGSRSASAALDNLAP